MCVVVLFDWVVGLDRDTTRAHSDCHHRVELDFVLVSHFEKRLSRTPDQIGFRKHVSLAVAFARQADTSRPSCAARARIAEKRLSLGHIAADSRCAPMGVCTYFLLIFPGATLRPQHVFVY